MLIEGAAIMIFAGITSVGYLIFDSLKNRKNNTKANIKKAK